MSPAKADNSPTITLRKPESKDCARVHKLISECQPLDENSTYCNLLQCTHFADTCVAAEDEESDLVGFISGYIPPKQQNVLFIWQVAVHEKARDRKSTRLNSSHVSISYAVFCLKKKKSI